MPPRIKNGRPCYPGSAALLASLCLCIGVSIFSIPVDATAVGGRRLGASGLDPRGSRGGLRQRPAARLRGYPAGRALDEWDDEDDDEFGASEFEDEAAFLLDDDGDGEGGDAVMPADDDAEGDYGTAPPAGSWASPESEEPYVIDDPAALAAAAAEHEGDAEGPAAETEPEGDGPTMTAEDDVVSEIEELEEELEELDETDYDDEAALEKELEISEREGELIEEAIDGGKFEEVAEELGMVEAEDGVFEMGQDEGAEGEDETEVAAPGPAPPAEKKEGGSEPIMCAAVYKPVCGSDGIVYSSDCDATRSGFEAACELDMAGEPRSGDGCECPVETEAAPPAEETPYEKPPPSGKGDVSMADQFADAVEGYAAPTAAAEGGEGGAEEEAPDDTESESTGAEAAMDMEGTADEEEPMQMHMTFTPPEETDDDDLDHEYLVDETAIAEQIDAIPYGDYDDDSVDADGNMIDGSEEVNEAIVEQIEEEIEGESWKR